MTHTPSNAAPSAKPTPVAANYRYWQLAGSQWGAEYDQRKRRQARYHIQELMIARYVERAAGMHQAANRQNTASKYAVLEFGCGVGRHLQNLAKSPGVDIYGHDQSPTMIAQIARWAPPEWIASHVRLGPPVGRLPYNDGQFALAYTSETLIHVRPEDLGSILTELVRVSGGHVLHMEPSPGFVVDRLSHDGCWNHDLLTAYRALGIECQMLPRGYASHTPYLINLSGTGVATPWTTLESDLWLRFESDMETGFTTLEKSLRAGVQSIGG